MMTPPPYSSPPAPSIICHLVAAFSQRFLLPLLAKYDGKYDSLFLQALVLVVRSRQFSIAHLQRHLRIGYSRACRIMAAVEATQLVTREPKRPR